MNAQVPHYLLSFQNYFFSADGDSSGYIAAIVVIATLLAIAVFILTLVCCKRWDSNGDKRLVRECFDVFFGSSSPVGNNQTNPGPVLVAYEGSEISAKSYDNPEYLD